jgi:hypothetical protein
MLFAVAFGKYSDYLLEWEKAMKGDVGFPLHVVYYENLQLVSSGLYLKQLNMSRITTKPT